MVYENPNLSDFFSSTPFNSLDVKRLDDFDV